MVSIVSFIFFEEINRMNKPDEREKKTFPNRTQVIAQTDFVCVTK